jgi:hypothetical protein
MVMLHVPVTGTGTELIVKVIVTQMKYPKKSEAVVVVRVYRCKRDDCFTMLSFSDCSVV